jgi:hypothetical protein
MTVILMSRSEIDRMNVLRDLVEDRIGVSEAATLIGLGRRQVFRLAKVFRQRGPTGLVSRRRGKPSNRSYPSALRTEVVGIVRERYADFGPTLAGEKLAELHGIDLARETIRQWMMAAGLWKDRRGIVAIALASWFRSMARSIGGSRRAGRNARCWSTSTMRRAG